MNAERAQGVRIAFPRALTNAQEAEQVLGEMIRQAGART